MKIQQCDPGFQPIKITLERKEEAAAFFRLIDAGIQETIRRSRLDATEASIQQMIITFYEEATGSWWKR